MRRFFTVVVSLFALWVATAAAQYGLRLVPLRFCSLSSISSATALGSASCATFTGTGSGTTLTASSVAGGSIQAGDLITGTGVPANTTIVSQLTGPAGGAGNYQTNNPTTSSGASLVAGAIPAAANYALICAYAQGIVWRDDGTAPTGTAGTGGQGVSSNSCFGYSGTLSAVQVVQQASGAVIGVSFYR